jgi:hypothetical protein
MKVKLLLPLMLICNLSFSQTESRFLIGGGLGYSYSDDHGSIATTNFIQNRESLLQFNPAVGYFIIKGLVAGIGIEYLYDKINYDNYVYYNTLENDLSIAPFVRFYTPFGLFLHAEFDYGTSKLTFNGRSVPGPSGYIDLSDAYHYNKIIGFSAGLGYSIKVNDFLSIEPSVRYLGSKFIELDPRNNFNRKGLLVNIGMVCFLK